MEQKTISLKASEINKNKLLNKIFILSFDKKIKQIAFLSTIKIRKENIHVLITGSKLINEESIEKLKSKVTISINKKNIDINLVKKIHLIDNESNISIIQIENNSLIENYFIELDENMFQINYEIKYSGDKTYILQNTKENKISELCPTIKEINRTIITFEENNENIDSNFSPIFINSNKNYQLIGLLDNRAKYFKGIFLRKIIKKFIDIYKCNKNKQNEIDILMNVDEKDVGKKMYFLSNNDIFSNIMSSNNILEDCNGSLMKINDLNAEIYIDNKRQNKFNKYFIPEKAGEYKIKLKFSIELTDCSFMFAGCNNIIKINLNSFNSEYVTNMKYMFYKCNNLKNINLSSFITKNVTDMSGIFYGCNSLENLDLSSFNTKNVTNMSYMFYKCDSLKGLNVSHFDTNKVSNMSYMFANCSKLENLDLSNYNVNNVVNYLIKIGAPKNINFEKMFYNCISIRTIDFCKNNNLNFSFEQIYNKIALNTIKDESNSESNRFINIRKMFEGNKSLNKLNLFDLDEKDICNNSYIFKDCNFIHSLSNINKNNDIKSEKKIPYYSNEKYIDFYIYFLNYSNIEIYSKILFLIFDSLLLFQLFYNDRKKCPFHILILFSFIQFRLFSLLFERSLRTYFNSIINQAKNVYDIILIKKYSLKNKGKKAHKEKIYPFRNEKVENNKINLIIKVDEKDVKKKMYFLCNDKLENNNIKQLNDSNTEIYINGAEHNFKRYFIPNEKREYKIELKFHFNLTDCSYMFAGCNNIIKINLNSFNTEYVTNMKYMFYKCNNLKNINLSSFITKNVTDMSGMFYECNSLENLDLSSFNTKNVTNMNYMFYKCNLLKGLNVSHFETNKVSNMTYMFADCSKIEKITLYYDLNNVKNYIYNKSQKDIVLENMFLNCENLKALYLCKDINLNPSSEENNTENIKNNKINYTTKANFNDKDFPISSISPNKDNNNNKMIESNKTLSKIFKFEKNSESASFINMSDICKNNFKLENLILFDFDDKNVYDNCYMFENCNKLIKITWPSIKDNIITYFNHINIINNNDNIDKMSYLYDNNKIYNQINISIYIDEKDVNKEIYFLCNDEHKNTKYINDNLKELNDSNTELYINGEPQTFTRHFKPSEKGEYKISLKFCINLADYNYIFSGCENNIKISFISSMTQNLSTIKYMIYNCKNLKNVNFISFDIKNDSDKRCMSYVCNKLNSSNLDSILNSFDSKNIINMKELFIDNYEYEPYFDYYPNKTGNIDENDETIWNYSKMNTTDENISSSHNFTKEIVEDLKLPKSEANSPELNYQKRVCSPKNLKSFSSEYDHLCKINYYLLSFS